MTDPELRYSKHIRGQSRFDIPSDPCDEGKYRSSGMTQCKKCDSGKIPNSDQSDCGKPSRL